MQVDQLEILANMAEDAYQLLKAQRAEKPKEEVKLEIGKTISSVEAKVVEEKPEEKPKQVLEASDVKVDIPLTWETTSAVLKLKKEV